jgi:hypothetical protein
VLIFSAASIFFSNSAYRTNTDSEIARIPTNKSDDVRYRVTGSMPILASFESSR